MPRSARHRPDLEATAALIERLDPTTRQIAQVLPGFLAELMPDQRSDRIAAVIDGILAKRVYARMPEDEALALFISDLSWELDRRGMNRELVKAFYATVGKLQTAEPIH